ncbi:MAG: hypothetical protein RMK52_07650 [Chitinophagales bacterium]|nr:hypothetical protein [Chitinophagales bacterium]MDW8394102.1 hypothetical protein [Chitinophagales bacterium]
MFSAEEGTIVFLREMDFVLLPIYLFFLLLFAVLYRNIKYRNTTVKQYFMPGLLVKIFGALLLMVIYGFYYKGGDTFYYFYDSKAFNNAIGQSLKSFFDLLFLPAGKITLATYEHTRWLTFFRDTSTWTADKVYGVLSVLSFHSYPVMSILMAFLSFTGVWAMYLTFVYLYPALHRQLAFCFLFVPSVFFWGSGILKDSITLGSLGWVVYTSHQIFFRRRKVLRNVLILVLTSYLALNIKAYILISFLPALMFWLFLSYRSMIGVKFIRVISGPAITLVAIVFGYFLIKRIGQEFTQFSLGNVLTTAQTFHRWHGYLSEAERASGYSLGEVDGSWQSVLFKLPAAVNVTLFRPYLWEARSVIMLFSSIESLILLSITIMVIWKNGLRNVLNHAISNPTVFFCFVFSLVFAFAVGFTSYNFGALVRYKIPCIPFFLAGLVILHHICSAERERKYVEELKRQSARANRYKSAAGSTLSHEAKPEAKAPAI